MKKMCVLFAIAAMLICSGITASAAGNIGVVIDQVPVQFNDSTGYPFIDGNGRTLVPLRAVMEAYGLQVDYNNGEITLHDPKDRKQDERTVTILVGDDTYHLHYFDVPYQVWRSYGVQMDTVAVVKDGRTYVPARAVLESFDAGVVWDKYRNQVVVRLDGTQAVIHEPYNDPAKSRATAGRERFGGTIDQVGLVVDYIKTSYEEFWEFEGKSYKNVNVTRATITNRGNKNIESIPLKFCVFNKITNELIYSEDRIYKYWYPREGADWSVIIPGYDKTKHDIEILLR